MPDERTAALLAFAAELESRDEVVAREIEAVDALAARTVTLRARAREVGAALDGLPGELDDACRAETDARSEEVGARAALAAAEQRFAALERRGRREERDQALRELTRAREEAHDARVRLDRAAELVVALGERRRVLADEAATLVGEAHAVAAGIREIPGVAEAGKGDPGADLAAVEEWGARARAALFVARGTLAEVRERIVIEANTLGSSVLGEPLGGSSVGIVRRRLEHEL